jgi:2-C-methyl-D-erythritol 4-phosphate cytidylyltransferase
MPSGPRYWAALPAAGTGTRLGAGIPKQYLQLRGRAILEWSLERMRSHPLVEGVAVALAPGDLLWNKLGLASAPNVMVTAGGAERCHSVLNCLHRLARDAAPGDWVLVHDAARPCVRREDIDALIDAVREHPAGGILALPARDTLKRADAANGIAETVERHGLWHALTPQLFRLGPLTAALESAIASGRIVTDEAQAMELAGSRPLLVRGHSDNIKITHGDDLALAELFLAQQEKSQ